MKTTLAYLLSLIAGCLLPFAFAPYGIWPLAFVSIALLFWLIRVAEPRTAARCGGMFGLGYFGLGVYWIYYSLHLFGDAVAPLSAFLTLIFVLVLCLFPLLVCWLYAKVNAHRPSSIIGVVLFAGCWLGSELLRDWLFGGFPWLSVGYSQIDSVFAGYAPIVGVYGISWVIVFMACSLVVVVTTQQRVNRLLAAVLLAVMAVGASMLSPIDWTQPRVDALAVRLVQGNIKQEMKFSRERLQSSLKTYVELSQDAPDGTDLVVWPETAIPTYFANVDEALEPFASSMSARGIDVLTGGFHRDEQGQVFNSVRQLGGNKALYSKRHLVPFGEFMPFRFIMDYVAHFIVIPMSDLSAATDPVMPLPIQDEQIGLSICYEDVFGGEMRALLPASTVLLNVSNDAWFGDSVAPHQHQEIAQMRAREFGRPLIRVTNTGISSAINYRGQVQALIAHNIKGILDVEVIPRTGSTPYVTLGNLPLLVLALLSLFGAMLLRRRANPQ